MKRKWTAALCALLLAGACVLGLLAPALAANRKTIYFIAVNDTVAELRDETMPFSSGGEIYVPYTVFDPNSTGIQLGVYASYGNNIVVLYGRTSGALIFDLGQDTAMSSTGEKHSKRAIRHNSTVFVPVDLVVKFFGLKWSIQVYPNHGLIVRVKNASAQIPDESFITAGERILESRYSNYLKETGQEPEPAPTASAILPPKPPPYAQLQPSASPSPSPSPTPPTPSDPGPAQGDDPPQPEGGDVYVAVQCTPGGDTAALSAALLRREAYGVFFFPADELAGRDGEVRALAAAGHKLGLLLDAADPREREEQARRGSALLAHILRARTDIALTEDGSELPEGWLSWPVTADGTAGGRTPALQEEAVLRGAVRAEDSFLLLDDTAQTAALAPRLLEQMEEEGCVFRLSLEPMLASFS